MPESITINIGKDAMVPVCPIPGRAWDGVVHKREGFWIATWTEEITGGRKYVSFAGSSQIKAQSDMEKFEKARQLKKVITEVRENYFAMLSDSDEGNRQLAAATYIIDVLAIRAGNEKGEDKADTVGCCSLRLEHVTLLEDHQLNLRFLGKDSIEYNNTIKIDQRVYTALESFRRNKAADAQLFHLIDTKRLNGYLDTLMSGLTAKVFRTYNASATL